ncbi:FeoA family protein [Paenibacillus sp. SYP-B4298]|uniref:FeoA family protein n=1 Tax=Paenibacillus sp. SYP-B4298 TaxID=2996034 RepID=UPI0022DD9339|nr:FeoA family protein [Paenibacillus sp. SYP-B4298]
MNSLPMIPLSACHTGQQFIMKRSDVQGVLRRRLLDLGFVPGAVIEVLQKSPLGDPVAYQVHHTTIALRHEEASRIFGCVKGEEEP